MPVGTQGRVPETVLGMVRGYVSHVRDRAPPRRVRAVREAFPPPPPPPSPMFSPPPYDPLCVITQNDSIARILLQPSLVIERQIEFMNVFLGFEQANQYRIMDPMGNVLGFMRERDFGIVKMVMRQVYRLHRPFLVDLFDPEGNHIFTIKRPFLFINLHIRAIIPGVMMQGALVEPEGLIVGESVQSWHLWRRRYNLFRLTGENADFDQFGAIDAPFLLFSFPVTNEEGVVMGAVDRNWVGIGRELFTDTGVYILRMGPLSFDGVEEYANTAREPMNLDQRAVLLANAVSVDFDYFSRHSNNHGMFGFGGGLYE